jgi:hypothetical protein
MSSPADADPTESSDPLLPPPPDKQPGDNPPMEPNPYMGGGTAPS